VVLDRPQCLATVWKIASIQNSLLTGQRLNGIIKVKSKNKKIKGKRFNFLRNYLKIAVPVQDTLSE